MSGLARAITFLFGLFVLGLSLFFAANSEVGKTIADNFSFLISILITLPIGLLILSVSFLSKNR